MDKVERQVCQGLGCSGIEPPPPHSQKAAWLRQAKENDGYPFVKPGIPGRQPKIATRAKINPSYIVGPIEETPVKPPLNGNIPVQEMPDFAAALGGYEAGLKKLGVPEKDAQRVKEEVEEQAPSQPRRWANWFMNLASSLDRDIGR